MTAPRTSKTVLVSPSGMGGLQVDRLYNNIRETAMSSILASESALFGVTPDGLSALYSFVDCLSYAIANEVILEIKSHSNLTAAPGATDKGSAGAGIIAGYLS
jgi:hypothetical protein